MTIESTASELRKTGVSVIGDVRWGTHFCYFYETKQDLLDLLIPYFKTGLEGNEFCLLIISNSELLKMEEAANALHGVLPDLDRYVAKRSMEFVGHDAWFLNGGSFDFQRVANQFKEKVDKALARGFVGMRVSASPAWLETSNPKGLRKFEAEVDQLYHHERIIASCTYPIGRSKADFLLDVARNHQFAIARRNGDWDIVETPELKRAKTEIERLNLELEQRVIERTKKLEATTARLRAEIEDRKETEEALRQSEERFAAFMDNLPGYAWMKDLQGRYVYVNEIVRGLSGYRSLGKTDAQIWPADLAAEYRVNDEQVIATKKPLNTLENYFQLRGEKRYMAGSKFPIFDRTGAVALVGGVGVDITERIEAEAALRESEAKLKQAQHLADIGYWERDLIADRITWSKETGRILGRESSRGVPNQAQLREFIHPDDWQHHQHVLNEALQGSRLFDVEVRAVRPDGNIRFVHIRDEIVRDESGKPIRMFGAVQDVTERRRAEEAVRRSEEHLRLVLATIPIMAWSAEPDGIVDFINQRWLDYAGLTFEQYLKDPMGAVHPDDVPHVVENWGAARMAGKPYEDEMRLQGADGEYRWFLVRSEPLRDQQGNIVKWYGSSIDIEDRKRAEMESRALIDAIPDQIWSGPPDGTNDYVNARWRSETGLSLEGVRGDGWQALLHPGDRERVLKAWQYSVETGTPYEQEERHRTADGTYRWYLNRGLALRDTEGRIVRWYGTKTDIEDRKRAEKKVEEANDQLRLLSRRLFHVQEEERRHLARELHDEIGQALTAAKLNLKIIAPDVPAEITGRLDDSIQLLDRLLVQVRELSLDLRPPLLDELGLVPALRWLVDQQAQRAQLHATFTANVDGLKIDPVVQTACFRVAQEAITNVIRHSGAKSVTIDLRRKADRLWLSVRDDGAGFDPAATQREAPPHSSLGLVSMKERASLAHGGLEVRSTPARGTEIRAWFPLSFQEPHSSTEAA